MHFLVKVNNKFTIGFTKLWISPDDRFQAMTNLRVSSTPNSHCLAFSPKKTLLEVRNSDNFPSCRFYLFKCIYIQVYIYIVYMLLYDTYPPAINPIVRLVKHQPISHLLVIYPFLGWLYTNLIPSMDTCQSVGNPFCTCRLTPLRNRLMTLVSKYWINYAYSLFYTIL